MSHIKTTLHGLNYRYEGPTPVVTTSHLLTSDAALAIEIARDLVRSAGDQVIDPSSLAKTACDIVDALHAQFVARRWRVKVPTIDADMLEKRYDIKKPEVAA